jgi:hypothetical protein
VGDSRLTLTSRQAVREGLTRRVPISFAACWPAETLVKQETCASSDVASQGPACGCDRPTEPLVLARCRVIRHSLFGGHGVIASVGAPHCSNDARLLWLLLSVLCTSGTIAARDRRLNSRLCLRVARQTPVIVPTTPSPSPHCDGQQHRSGHAPCPHVDIPGDVVVAPSKILCAVTHW